MDRAEGEAIYDAGREACVEFLVELSSSADATGRLLGILRERLCSRRRQLGSPASCSPQDRPVRHEFESP